MSSSTTYLNGQKERSSPYLILISIFPVFVFLSCKFLVAGNVCVLSSIVII